MTKSFKNCFVGNKFGKKDVCDTNISVFSQRLVHKFHLIPTVSTSAAKPRQIFKEEDNYFGVDIYVHLPPDFKDLNRKSQASIIITAVAMIHVLEIVIYSVITGYAQKNPN
ncbi:hypothetical protein RRG08_048456 [Elysia crispata]|uniref:Uncharacterized protein n=1 Tax=Elysia crispata TaxID=231223 RepID=A0AAE1EBU6_9GAST|nr:hypothetical protein RRG08_048456 [Elysia crispata]